MQIAIPIRVEVILFTVSNYLDCLDVWSPYSTAISPPRSLFDGCGHEPIANRIAIALQISSWYILIAVPGLKRL